MPTEPNIALPLGNLNVAVVGAGRIGTELIRNLGLMGIGRIDVYEREHRTGEPLRSRYDVCDGDFWDTLTLARLRDYDFAIGTMDEPRARERLNRKCLLANVNLLLAWTEGSLAIVSAHPFGALADAACGECTVSGDATPLPIAALRLSVADADAPTEATRIATASVAGALAAALVARIAAGSHGRLSRRGSLDATTGHGATIELRRDPHCAACGGLQRPVPIVHTRNRWAVPPDVAHACPDMLNQRLQLSDEIDGLAPESCSVRELAARFHGGPIPAKFALTDVGGRMVCLDFEEPEARTAPAAAHTAAGFHRAN